MYPQTCMKRVLTALVLIPLVLVLVFLAPDGVVTAAVALVAMLAAWEFLSIAQATGAKPPRVATLVAIGVLYLVSGVWPEKLPILFGALALSLLIYRTFSGPVATMLPDATTAVFALFYTGSTLLTLPLLRAEEEGKSLLVFLLCVVWAGDITALYVGKRFGKDKLAPSISPNKTWEGTAGSVAGSVLVAAGLYGLATLLARREIMVLAYPGHLGYWLGMAVLVNVAAQVGDLAESALKRSAGVKDSGNLLPGHGGMLDRIDALLVAAPVLWYALEIQHF